jgi:hypothetical protein
MNITERVERMKADLPHLPIEDVESETDYTAEFLADKFAEHGIVIAAEDIRDLARRLIAPSEAELIARAELEAEREALAIS